MASKNQPKWEYATTARRANYQLLGVVLLEVMGKLLVVVDYRQLKTTASETVVPIDYVVVTPHMWFGGSEFSQRLPLCVS